MTRIHKAVSVLIILGGVGHSLATFAEFNALSTFALWFLGSGLMLVFLGLLNLALAFSSGEPGILGRLTLTANALGAAFMIPLYWTTRATQPLVFIALIAVAGVAALRLQRQRNADGESSKARAFT